MTTNAKIKSDIQKLNIQSELIELYELDATSLGGSTYYFVPGTVSGTAVVFNGITYSPLPVEVTGMDWDSDGKLPRPKIRVANVNLTFGAFVNAYNDGIGAKITRKRTFRKYLDEQAEADPNAEFPHDVFYIEQKTAQNKFYIEWELVAPVDIEGRFVPKGQVIAICPRIYRRWDGEEFVYNDNNQCPYTGTDYFTEQGVATTSGNDRCGKKLRDCELRFPNQVLPFKGFPGVGQISRQYR